MNIGFVVYMAENRETGRAQSYPEMRRMARRAESMDFDSIWLYDHLLYRSERSQTVGIWECWTVLSALAEATERVELGTLVLCNSFRNPAILAKMAVTLDEVCGGRFIMGIGAGWNEAEYKAFGIPFDHRVDRFEEALQIINPLIKEGSVDFEGRYYQARDCVIRPAGPRKQGPPLMVGTQGPRMLRLTAQYADIWNTAILAGPASLQEPLNKYFAACREVGRDPRSLEITGLVALSFPDLGDPPVSIDEYLTGTPGEIAAALLEYESMGVTHLMFHCYPYNDESQERLAEAVRIYRAQSGTGDI